MIYLAIDEARHEDVCDNVAETWASSCMIYPLPQAIFSVSLSEDWADEVHLDRVHAQAWEES